MKKMYTYAIASIILAIPFFVKGQVSTPNNFGIAGNYVGWDNTNAFPLQIAHKGNQPIDFYTANSHRLRINDNFIFGSATMNDTTGTAEYLHLHADC